MVIEIIIRISRILTLTMCGDVILDTALRTHQLSSKSSTSNDTVDCREIYYPVRRSRGHFHVVITFKVARDVRAIVPMTIKHFIQLIVAVSRIYGITESSDSPFHFQVKICRRTRSACMR